MCFEGTQILDAPPPGSERRDLSPVDVEIRRSAAGSLGQGQDPPFPGQPDHCRDRSDQHASPRSVRGRFTASSVARAAWPRRGVTGVAKQLRHHRPLRAEPTVRDPNPRRGAGAGRSGSSAIRSRACPNRRAFLGEAAPRATRELRRGSRRPGKQDRRPPHATTSAPTATVPRAAGGGVLQSVTLCRRRSSSITSASRRRRTSVISSPSARTRRSCRCRRLRDVSLANCTSSLHGPAGHGQWCAHPAFPPDEREASRRSPARARRRPSAASQPGTQTVEPEPAGRGAMFTPNTATMRRRPAASPCRAPPSKSA